MWKVVYVVEIQRRESWRLIKIASVHFTSWRKQSHSVSTSNYIIGRITVVSMLMNSIIP
jgi:hypothetical protein